MWVSSRIRTSSALKVPEDVLGQRGVEINWDDELPGADASWA
jgi:hypothetical protein